MADGDVTVYLSRGGEAFHWRADCPALLRASEVGEAVVSAGDARGSRMNGRHLELRSNLRAKSYMRGPCWSDRCRTPQKPAWGMRGPMGAPTER